MRSLTLEHAARGHLGHYLKSDGPFVLPCAAPCSFVFSTIRYDGVFMSPDSQTATEFRNRGVV